MYKMSQLRVKGSLWLLVGVVVMMYSLVLPPPTAHAAPLAGTITAGSTTSTDDNVPTGGGTNLDVPTMLTNAGAAAVFSALRLTFLGTLKITLPATEAAWTPSNVPLQVLIKDGLSGASPYPIPFIEFTTGVLSAGSTVIVEGGTYTYQDTFLKVASGGISIIHASLLSITGGVTFTADHISGTYQATYLVNVATKFILANSSTFSVTNIIQNGVNEINPGFNWLFFFCYFNNAPVTISDGSLLAVNGNTYSLTTVSMGTVHYFLIHLLNCNLLMTTGGTASMSSNTLTLTSVTATANIFLRMFDMNSGVVTMESGSNLTVSNNNLVFSTVNSPLMRLAWFFTSFDSTITDGTFNVVGNTYASTSVTSTSSYGFSGVSLFASLAMVSSIMTVSNNVVTMTSSTLSSSATSDIYFSSGIPSVDANSILTFTGNSMTALSVSDFKGVILRSQNEVQVDGRLEANMNTVSTTGSTANVAHIMEATWIVSGNGSITMKYNSVSNHAGATIAPSLLTVNTVGTPFPNIFVCYNKVSGVACTVDGSGTYSCAGGVNLVGEFHQCTRSASMSPTLTLPSRTPITTNTLSKTLVATPSLSHESSPTLKVTRSDTRFNTGANTTIAPVSNRSSVTSGTDSLKDAPLANTATLAVSSIGLGGATVSGVDGATSIQLIVIITTMACRYREGSASRQDEGGSGLLNPIRIPGLGPSRDLVGSLILGTSIIVGYLLIMQLVFIAIRRFSAKDVDLVARLWKVRLFTLYPRLPVMAATLLLPGIVLDGASLLYGDTSDVAEWWEKFIGLIGVLLSAGLVVYHVLVGRASQKYIMRAVILLDDGAARDENATTHRTRARNPLASKPVDDDDAAGGVNAANPTKKRRPSVSILPEKLEGEGHCAEPSDVEEDQISATVNIAAEQPSTKPDIDNDDAGEHQVKEDESNNVKELYSDNEDGDGDAAANEANDTASPKEESTPTADPTASTPVNLVIDSWVTKFSDEERSVIPKVVRVPLLPELRWAPQVGRTLYCILTNLRPQVAYYVVSHSVARVFLIGMIAATVPEDKRGCTIVDAILAAICFIHAIIILTLRIFRANILTLIQGLQSILLGFVALIPYLGGDDSEVGTGLTIAMLVVVAIEILCGIIVMGLELLLERRRQKKEQSSVMDNLQNVADDA